MRTRTGLAISGVAYSFSVSLMQIPPFLTPDRLDPMADALANQGYTWFDGWLPTEQALCIRQHLLSSYQQNTFKRAGIGKDADHQIDRSKRGDHIHWIEEQSSISEVREFFSRMQQLSQYLNRSCYLGLKDLEAHFTVYPPGTHYERHLDQFRADDHRKLTFIYYLNPDWQESDGGHLVIYLPDGSHERFTPLLNRLVVFRSELLEHEVLPTQRDRCSLTGWLLDQRMDLGFLG
jgi:SM-20-related protein